MSAAAARLLAALLGLLAAGGLALCGAVTEQAAAHADRIATAPSAGQTVPVTTDRVVLEFTEAILPGSAQVDVRAADGASAAAGDLELAADVVSLPVRLAP